MARAPLKQTVAGSPYEKRGLRAFWGCDLVKTDRVIPIEVTHGVPGSRRQRRIHGGRVGRLGLIGRVAKLIVFERVSPDAKESREKMGVCVALPGCDKSNN